MKEDHDDLRNLAENKPLIRKFSTGATRDVNEDKLNFEGFLSPLVIKEFARYMHFKRRMADGSLRDADNWQKGIPLDAYMESAWRHFFDWWANHRGVEPVTEDIKTTLVGLLFNVQGYLHEILKAEAAKKDDETFVVTYPNAAGAGFLARQGE